MVDFDLIEKSKLLRELVPIGLNGAIKLLKNTGGDIKYAASLFKQQTFDLAKAKTSMPDDVVKKHLETTNYNLEKTLKLLFDEKYTITERILLNINNKEKALSNIQYAIEVDDNLKRNFWLDIEDIKKLNQYRYCIVIVCEWLNYEDWEGFLPAICSSFCERAIGQIEKELNMPHMAKILSEAYTICDKYYSTKRAILETPDIDIQNTYFYQHRKEIIDKLHSFVETNIKYFP